MKWAKYALIAVAPIILAVGVWSALRGGSATDIPDSVTFVDVSTGDLVTMKRGSFISVPAMNDRDKKFTLYIVNKDESGAWVVNENLREQLLALPESERSKIDPQTFRVR